MKKMKKKKDDQSQQWRRGKREVESKNSIGQDKKKTTIKINKGEDKKEK
jgi:hypothetical protein